MTDVVAVGLRAVTSADIKKIYEWRNHSSVRANSFQTAEIKFDEHVAYWEKRLRDRKNYSYVVLFRDGDAGLVRLDNKSEKGDSGTKTYEVNILIAPEFQGKGLGIAAIAKTKEMAERLGIKKLVARVKPGNAPSQKIFEKNGFEIDDRDKNKEYVIYKLEI